MTAPLIAPLPAVPSAAASFAADADAFLAAIPTMITESNAQATFREGRDPEIVADARAAIGALTVTEWVSGTTYAVDAVAWSPITYLDYVRTVAGAGTTDPSADPANWQLMTGAGDATTTGAESLSSKTFRRPAMSGAMVEDIYTITDGGSVDIDPANGSIQIWELGANRTPTAANFANGQAIALMVWDAAWSITWSTIGVHWINGVAPILVAGKYAVITLWKDGGTVYGKFLGNAGRHPALFLDFLDGEVLDSRITASGGANGTRVNSSGVIVAATTPRFDHDPVTHAPKGLLIEEARTNLLLRSAELDNASWDKSSVTVTANDGVAPDGTTTADRITYSSSGARVTQTVTAPSAAPITYSVFLKAGTGSNTARLLFRNATTATNMVIFPITDLANGSDGGVPFGNGWYRYVITVSSGISTSDTLICYVYTDSTGGTVSGSNVLVWGAQLEAGAFATSYIPTAGSAVTRSADSLNMTSTNFSSWFNQTEGAFVAEFDLIAASTVSPSNRILLSANDGGANERAMIYNGSSQMTGYVVDGGSDQAYISAGGTIAANTPAKASLAYKANDFGSAVNGTLGTSDSSGTLPTVDRLGIGGQAGSSTLNGHIQRLAFYDSRLVNSELQRLTA